MPKREERGSVSYFIQIKDILVEDRMRQDMGDIDSLSNSIKEFGLIQPIVLTSEKDFKMTRLVAGGRRLTAIKRLGWTELLHGRDFIWRDELKETDDEKKKLRLKSVELEENLKRQELTWQEQVKAKKQLLELMQSIYGVPSSGGLTRLERMGVKPTGFGVNKLAAMLGESNAQTSKDLELANVIEKIPSLAKADTKESARRQFSIIGAVASMQSSANKRAASSPQSEAKPKLWVLHEGDFRDYVKKVQTSSVDLVYTDLPYGVSLSSMSSHSKGLIEYADGRDDVVSMLQTIAFESYRILHDDRFAVFWFGFNYYQELLISLRSVGFNVNIVPFIWYKRTRTTENPNTRYANSYDAAILAMKGSPVFIRPGQQNFVDIPAVIRSDKLQIAQQPVELCERFILDCTSPSALVVDFCAGSGSTGVAALKNKRHCVLFEREQTACTLIKARLGLL